MAYKNDAPFQVRKHIQLIDGVNLATIGGNITLTLASSMIQVLNGGGSDRDVVLPAEDMGLHYWIKNTGGSNNLVVKNDAGGTVQTLIPGQAMLCASTNASWNVIIKA